VCASSFVVDSADEKMFQPAKKELQELLSKPSLAEIPLLLLFNKNDLKTAVKPEEIAQAL
jgi:ADP-ribosylation factor-like protein 8